MKLSKLGRVITIVVVALFVLGLIGLVATAANRDDSGYVGSLENKLQRMDDEGLHGTALAPVDVYGEDWVAAGIVCPGTPADDVEKIYEVSADDAGIKGDSTPADENIVLLRGQEGEVHADHVKTDKVNLCTAPLQGYFDAHTMIPFMKTQDGTWALAAG